MTFNVDAFVINNRNRNETIEILALLRHFARVSLSEKNQFQFNEERFVTRNAEVSSRQYLAYSYVINDYLKTV